MDKTPDPGIDWSLATWEGGRRQQHRDFLALPFRRKLELIEELGEVSAVLRFASSREAGTGLPATRWVPKRAGCLGVDCTVRLACVAPRAGMGPHRVAQLPMRHRRATVTPAPSLPLHPVPPRVLRPVQCHVRSP